MKLVLIGAASAAVLAIAGPAAAQYRTPPPPPPGDQYNPSQPPQDYRDAPDQADQDANDPDDQDEPDDQGQPGPGDAYGDQAGPPPGDDQGYPPPPSSQPYDARNQGRYPPPADRRAYPQPPAGQPYDEDQDQGQYGPPQDDQYGPDSDEQGPPAGYGPPDQGEEPGGDLAHREEHLERKIHRQAERGRIDPGSADGLLAVLSSIRADQARAEQGGSGLNPVDQNRIERRLSQLQQRFRAMVDRGG
jgi:hypothetical protein